MSILALRAVSKNTVLVLIINRFQLLCDCNLQLINLPKPVTSSMEWRISLKTIKLNSLVTKMSHERNNKKLVID